MICHDKNLKRLTGIDVLVSELNFCDLPKLKDRLEIASQPKGTFWEARNTKAALNLGLPVDNKTNNNPVNGIHKRLTSREATDLSIPKLEDVFKAFPKTLINLDVKSGKRELMDMVADLVIKYDDSSHKYPVTANRKLKPKSLVRVLKKGGRYIFNLGTVNFLEVLILNLFLVVYCYQMETELITEM